ncbi:MAG: DUF805 domain-containing protein [Asticcacaulis sp.]|uniref:DUF805 domain-containing protein n=1 Tax=Asticcacaulis sp. TaxID=1872648 RepID=UPI0039E4FAE2
MIAFLFSPKGRISGTQFFSSLAILMLVMVIIGFGLGTVPAVNGPIVLSVCWVLLAWPLACLVIKRLHDTGRSALWLWGLAPQPLIACLSLAMGGFMPAGLLWLMTLLGVLANLACWSLLFFLALKPGDEGDNDYGADPHQRDRINAAET